MKSKNSPKKIKQIPNEQVRVNLPADYGWKVLGALAEDLRHLFTDEENSRISSIVRSRNYVEYLALSEEWSPQCTGNMVSARAKVQAKYQMASLLKKFRFPSDDAARRKAAIKKFIAAELACRDYNQDGWKSLAANEDDRMCNVYTYARVFLEKVLGTFLPSKDRLTEWSRHGPGANLDTMHGQTNLYNKYSEFPYSCTKGASGIARLAIQDDERWLGALEDSYRERENIPKHEILNQEAFWSAIINVVPGNRVAFVPKNALTERSIAIEPSLNLYLQLGVDGYIRRRLKRWGIDLDCQNKNRELARVGSRDWESPENFVTLDLAAASDSISVELCRTLLPNEWFDYLMKLRSPIGELDGVSFRYEKISSMGNGYTFALESAIFAAVVYGVQREFLGGYQKDECAIYGDDLIVKSTIAPQLVTALNLFGFNVNQEKSFLQGPFRESCGADWFKGKPVRPVFLSTQPTSVMELWTDINRLKRFLALRFMVDESLTEKLLCKWVPEQFRLITGPLSDEDFDSYRHSTTPVGVRKEWLWKYRRVVVIPKPVGGRNFLMRKLMHNLREQPSEPSYMTRTPAGTWKGCKLTRSGSRFTITRPHLVKVGYSFSVADYWQSEYEEVLPWPVRKRAS